MSSNFFVGDSLNNQVPHLRGDQSAGKSAEESSPKVLSPLEKHIQRRRKTRTATLASPRLICSHITASPWFKSTAKEYQFGWHTKGCTKRVQSHVCVKMPLGNPRNTLPSLAFFPPLIIYTTWWKSMNCFEMSCISGLLRHWVLHPSEFQQQRIFCLECSWHS